MDQANNLIRKNAVGKILFFLGFLSIILVLFYHKFYSPRVDLDALLPEVIPDASQYQQINRDPIVYEGRKDDKVVGYAVVEKATGYQSPITMMVGADMEGKINNTLVVEHQETPTFFRRLIDKEFFKQFIGREIKDGFTSDNIDAVGGSTISSQAITRAVNIGTNYLGKNYMEMNMPSITQEVEFGQREALIIGLMVLAVYATYRRKAKIRTFALTYSIVVLGFWYNAFITYATIGTIVTGSVPMFSENISWYILVGGAFGLILFTGKNIFCYWICPFGAFQEMLAKISGKTYKLAHHFHKYAKLIPGFLAWLALFISLLVGNPTAASYEPFATLFSQVGSNIQWILLPIVLLSSLVVYRFWCGYFCPVGYVLNLCVKLRSKGVKVWKKREKPGKTISS